MRLAVIAAFVVATAGLAGLSAVSAQGPATKKAIARTPDGQPDLQGYWTNSTYVPLERPEKVNKALYTEAEFAALVKDAASREAEQTEPGTVADVHYDFS